MKTKILVIDDGRQVRDFLMRTVLTSSNFEVLIAKDGARGLEMAREAQPDLIITDQYMPGCTGIQVIAALRAEGNDVPTILMTGEGSETLAQEAVRAGVSAYILKPFDGDEMLAAIGRALRDVQRQREMARMAADLTSRLRELEELSSIGQAITGQLDLDTVLSRVVESAVNLTGAEEGFVLLLEDRTGDLIMRAAKNFDDSLARTFRLPVGDSFAGRVVQTGQPLLLNASGPQKIKTAYLVHALLYVPLRAYGRVLGVLGVDNRERHSTFTEHQQSLMVSLSDYAGIAIQNARMFRDMHTLAITDSLTGLHNRRHFFEEAAREFDRARRYRHALSALMLDIDHFKKFNDSYGHAAGDQALRNVAALCRKGLREIDILARYGGEEFVALLPETPAQAGMVAAERLRRLVAEMTADRELERHALTVSVGVAALTDDCPDLNALLARADAALYAAKAAGRNRVEAFAPPGSPA
jgi:diguanylate cyclase (GGDEF)-like protein